MSTVRKQIKKILLANNITFVSLATNNMLHPYKAGKNTEVTVNIKRDFFQKTLVMLFM
jgi:hypothetical protein